MVFAYTPAGNETIDITLCADSQYDTKLFVYEYVHTPGAPFACNDDSCTTLAGQGFVSELLGLNLTGGNTYFIVIDGWNSAFGVITLDIN